jgi:preprotein translocase subunit SecF
MELAFEDVDIRQEILEICNYGPTLVQQSRQQSIDMSAPEKAKTDADVRQTKVNEQSKGQTEHIDTESDHNNQPIYVYPKEKPKKHKMKTINKVKRQFIKGFKTVKTCGKIVGKALLQCCCVAVYCFLTTLSTTSLKSKFC